MSRVCSICTHPRSGEIDQAVVSRDGSLRQIAAQHAVSETALRRHRSHIDSRLAKAAKATAAAEDRDLLDKVRDGLKTLEALQSRLATILSEAWGQGDKRTALAAIAGFPKVLAEMRANIDLISRIRAQTPATPEVDLLLTPEWVHIRNCLADALVPYPEAREAVAQALARLEEGEDHDS